MRTSFKQLCIGLIFLAVAACNLDKYQPITVVVYPSVKRCTVKQQDDEQLVECTQLGVYLRDTLKIAANREIAVSFSGSDTVAKDDPSIDRVAELIRSVGYKNVRAIRIGL